MRNVSTTTTLFLTAVLLLSLAACDRGSEQVRAVFTVEGMHCDSCSTSIVTTLEKVEGVVEVKADHEAGSAEAVFRPRQAKAEELKVEIEKLGFTVTGIETKPVES